MADTTLENKDQEVETPDYKESEKTAIGVLQKRLNMARDNRNSKRDEFDGMDYLTWYDTNERLANTYVGARKNKADTDYQSGTVRQKLFAFLATINKMNLKPDVSAFDKNELRQEDMGNAMTDILRKTEELDGDDEKQLHRQYELLKQGTVFVEELWVERKRTEKKLEGKFTGKLDVKWASKQISLVSNPERTILYGPGVYLGDMSVFDIKNQPFVFTRDVIPYEKAKQIFGKWDRWKFVSKKKKSFNESDEGGIYNNAWRLDEVEPDRVEVIRYFDKPNGEFQILLNGVLMLKLGFPLTEVSPSGEYPIVQQILEIIHLFTYDVKHSHFTTLNPSFAFIKSRDIFWF